MSDPTSPLLSASPEALAALFEADPLTLSDAEVMASIHELRRRRNVFAAEEAAKSLKPKSTRTKAEPRSPSKSAELDKPPGELSLDDLL